MAKIPVLDAIRIIPRDDDFLDRKSGLRGEVFFDRTANTLRIYDGLNTGGINLAKSDLTNVTNSDFLSKAVASGVGSGGGNVTVSVGTSTPSTPANGNLWLNTNNGVLYVYINDGNSSQWIQPSSTTPNFADVALSGSYTDLINTPTFSAVATSGDYDDLINKPTISLVLTDLGITDGTVGQVLTTDGDGNFTFEDSVGAPIGSFAFVGTNIDTTDSSSISITPSVTFQSNVSVENELSVRNDLFVENRLTVDSIVLQGELLSQGSGTPEIVSDNEIIISPGTTTILNGLTTFYQSTEVYFLKVGSTGTVVHDFAESAIWSHENILANFTANFINVPTTSGRIITVSLLLVQGLTPRIPNAVQIDGVPQTILWLGGTVPTGTANRGEIVSFTLIRSTLLNFWTVTGSLTSYG
jgi:hypothetical protein